MSGPARTLVVSHPDCVRHDPGPGHPERPDRLRAVLEALREEAAAGETILEREGRHATDEEIGRVHPPEHVASIRRAVDRAGERGLLYIDGDTAVNPASFDAALAAAGSAVGAVDGIGRGEAENAFCAVRPPGHHATATRAMGFCLFNNVAIAVRHAQARWGWRRAVIVDWDLHHGNGTQDIFYEDADVYYISMHESPLYPGTGSSSERGRGAGNGTTRNLPQPPGLASTTYADALRTALDEVAAEFEPDAIFISAGFDAAAGDPLGGMTLRPTDYHEWTERLTEWARRACRGRLVSVLEGGYDLRNLQRCARAHVRALAGAPPPTEPR